MCEKPPLEEYWPNWMQDIGDARRWIESTCEVGKKSAGEIILLQSVDVLLKGMYWLLKEQADV